MIKNNLVGKVFGDLKIIKEVRKPKSLRRNGFYWLARCKCGNEIVAITQSFVHEGRSHCGCKRVDNLSKSHLGKGVIDIIGKKFGRLTVIRREGVGANGKFKYLCKCDCGSEIIALGASLRRKKRPTYQCLKCGRKQAKKKISGPNNYLWNPNITEEERILRKNRERGGEEKAWRKKIFQRDKYTCQLCNKKGGNLNAHHLNSYVDYKDQRWDVNNGITLHESCHRQYHIFYGVNGATKLKFNSFIEYKRNSKNV